MLDAILSVLREGGEKASATSLDRVKAVVKNNLASDDESVRLCNAKCAGMVCAFADAAAVSDLLIDLIGDEFGSLPFPSLNPFRCANLT